MKLKSIFIFAAILMISVSLQAQAEKTVSTVRLANTKDVPANLPFIGQKVVVVMYIDPDVSEINDPLAAALEKERFPLDVYAPVGVVNCKDTWIPNALIRSRANKKQERFPKSIILLDEAHTLQNSWKLEDGNNKMIVVIVGKDSKIKFLKSVKTEEETKAIIPDVIKTVKNEISK